MNKESFGAFIAQERKNRDLTQRDLADRLHVTDKAVSKWERGLSYPDVTLLEPLAEALDLGVEELMACRRQTAEPPERGEEPMKNLLTISNDTVQREKKRSWGRLAGVALLALVTGLAIAYSLTTMTEQREDTIFLKETVDGVNYLYVEEEGHLLKLKCGDGMDFNSLEQLDAIGREIVYNLDCRWNRLTHTGTVSKCEEYGVSLGGLEGNSSGACAAEVFGIENVLYADDTYYRNPYGEGFLCDAIYWEYDGEVSEGLLGVVVDGQPGYPPDWEHPLLLVEDCVNTVPADYDGDGVNEVVVRTRWPEKPYTVYDMVDGEITEVWPDTIPDDIRDRLICIWEQ